MGDVAANRPTTVVAAPTDPATVVVAMNAGGSFWLGRMSGCAVSGTLTWRDLRCAQHLAAAVLISILLLSCVGGTASADEPQLLAVQPISGPPGTAVTVTGRGWSPRYYASGVRIGFAQNFGNGVLKKYADDIVVKPNANGTLSFRSAIPRSFKAGDVVTFSGLIGNGSGANANFTVTGAGGSTATADLQPTAIMFNRTGIAVGKSVHFDSGVRNTGSAGTGVFNIKWLVDGHEVSAQGSHAGVPAGRSCSTATASSTGNSTALVGTR